MGLIRKHNEIKVEILESLSRSQRALARIIESMADISGTSEVSAMNLQQNIEAITRYQETLMVKLFGIRPSRVRSSLPARPWTNTSMNVLAGAGCEYSKKDTGNKVMKTSS
jgi:hypothetical protein